MDIGRSRSRRAVSSSGSMAASMAGSMAGSMVASIARSMAGSCAGCRPCMGLDTVLYILLDP